MNKHDLLDIIGDAKDEYVLEALKTKKKPSSSSKVIPMKKAVLIAAVIAVMLLLAGCAAVFMWLRDMSIAQEPYTRQYDAYGRAVEPEEAAMEVLSLSGLSGSPVQKAAKEWYAFCEGYDPNGELLTNTMDDPDIPNNYEYTYHCYTPEMVDKLDEITSKYGLKLLDSGLVVQDWQWQAALEGIGLRSLFRPDAEVDITHQAGILCTAGSYWMDVSFRMTGADTLWKTPVSARFSYHQKEYMAPPQYLIIDPDSYEEWTYTSADGTRLLLALSSNGTALILADQGDAVISVSLTISANHLMSENGAAPTKAAVEQLADTFDYAVKPAFGRDAEALASRLAEIDEAYWAERNTVTPVTYTGFTDYLKSNALQFRKCWYTYYDLDGNGEQDLLISGDQETFITCVFSLGGEPSPRDVGLEMCLLENGGVVQKNMIRLDLDAANTYYAPIAEGVALRPLEEEYMLETGKFLVYIGPDEEGNWIRSDSEKFYLDENRRQVTEAEAREIMAQYPVIKLNWLPFMEHPLGDGTTVADYLTQNDVRLPEGELIAKYTELAAEMIEYHQYCRFNLVDINHDGVLDLLLSSDAMADLDPDSAFTYWSAYTYRYGTLMKLEAADFYLCRDGVLENTGKQTAPGGGRGIRHRFMRLDDSEVIILADLLYDLSTDTWVQAETEEVISSDEANAILEKYSRIDQGMRPISELLNP